MRGPCLLLPQKVPRRTTMLLLTLRRTQEICMNNLSPVWCKPFVVDNLVGEIQDVRISCARARALRLVRFTHARARAHAHACAHACARRCACLAN
jgi:hypothetical protein